MGLELLNGFFDGSDVLNILFHQRLIVLPCLVQAVNQGAQLALRLGELILLPGQIQLILTLIGNIHGSLAGGIHKLHTLFLNLVEIKFKHEKHLFFHSFVAAFPKALCCSLLFAL